MIAFYPVGYVFASNVLAASIDFAGIGSIVAGLTAFVALFLGHRNNRRAAQTTESVSYVDNNLKTMQATLDWLTLDNTRLREVNEQQRQQMVHMTEELQNVKFELLKCKELCIILSGRLDEQIGSPNDGNQTDVKRHE